MNNVLSLEKEQILILNNASKSYQEGKITTHILKNINLNLAKGEVLALLGASGSGKSTLLNIIGLLDNLNSGSLTIDGTVCNNLNEKQGSEIRKNKLGFVFQFHHLLVDFTSLENVMMPALIKKEKQSSIKEKAIYLLEAVGLKRKINKYPSELSGGEKQRVAIARAIINNPVLILADEPTGNLDSELSLEVCDLIINLVKQHNSAAIIATHDLQIANKIGQKIFLKDGIIANTATVKKANK